MNARIPRTTLAGLAGALLVTLAAHSGAARTERAALVLGLRLGEVAMLSHHGPSGSTLEVQTSCEDSTGNCFLGSTSFDVQVIANTDVEILVSPHLLTQVQGRGFGVFRPVEVDAAEGQEIPDFLYEIVLELISGPEVERHPTQINPSATSVADVLDINQNWSIPVAPYADLSWVRVSIVPVFDLQDSNNILPPGNYIADVDLSLSTANR